MKEHLRTALAVIVSAPAEDAPADSRKWVAPSKGALRLGLVTLALSWLIVLFRLTAALPGILTATAQAAHRPTPSVAAGAGENCARGPAARSAPTLAAMAAIPGDDGDHIFCDETQSEYRLDASATQNDGFVQVRSMAATGSWVHQGGDLFLSAIDGQSDDWPRLMAALTATASAKKRLVMKGGVTWICATAPGHGALSETYIPSFARLSCDPDVVIRSTLTPSGGPGGYEQSPFYTVGLPRAVNGALVAPAPAGATTITVALNGGTLALGDWIAMENSSITNVAEYHQVAQISPAGSGTAVLQLDEPTALAWASPGTQVQAYEVRENIDLNFNGAEVTGTGDRAIELAATMHSRVRGLRVTPRFGSFAWGGSFDIGGRYNTWERCTIDGGGAAIGAGLGLESNFGSVIVDSTVNNLPNVAFFLPDCQACAVRGGGGTNNRIGVFVGDGGTNDVIGAVGVHIEGVTLTSNALTGVLIGNGSDLTISDSTVGGGGVSITPSSGGGANTVKLRSVTIHDTSGDGLVVANANVTASNLTIDRAGGYAVRTESAAQLRLDGLTVAQTSIGSGPWYVGDQSRLWIRDFDVKALFDGSWMGVAEGSSADLRLENGTLTAGGAGTKAVVDMEGPAGGAVRLDQVTAAGSGWAYGIYAAHGNGARVYRYRTVDLSPCTYPFTFDATALANFGTITANGTSSVAIASPSPLFGPGQTMVFSVQSAANGPGAIIASLKAGGASVQSSAGDASTYTWYVAD